MLSDEVQVHPRGNRWAALHDPDLGGAGSLFGLFLPIHLVLMTISHVVGDVSFVLPTKWTLISLLFLKNDRKLEQTSLSPSVKYFNERSKAVLLFVDL